MLSKPDPIQRLITQISLNGPIQISRLVKHSLFDPIYGHYQNTNPISKKNECGDFITSPEISQVFGELIGAYITAVTSNYERISLVEAGAGNGSMMKDMITSLQKLSTNDVVYNFFKKTDFSIIETSKTLVNTQKSNLSTTGLNIKWHENFAEFVDSSSSSSICFIANEFFDCLGVNQYVYQNSKWCEILVGAPNKDLEFITSQPNDSFEKLVISAISQDSEIKNGSIIEISPDSMLFMSNLCDAISNKGGIAIICDYGYIKSPLKSTLQAISNHKKCDVLQNLFKSDLTNLVDFSSLIKIVESKKLNYSIVSQREFLLSLGIEERRSTLTADKAKEQIADIESQIDRLIDVDQMGELFKFLIVWK